MTSRRWILLGLVWAVIGATALFLGYLRKNHQLGAPGLKMIAQPVYDESGEQIGAETVALPDQVDGYESRIVPVANAETASFIAQTA